MDFKSRMFFSLSTLIAFSVPKNIRRIIKNKMKIDNGLKIQTSMATNNSAKPKEMEISRDKKNYIYDMVKSDGQFKEMIGMQELARDAWTDRWGFMNRENILQIYEEHAAKLDLPLDFMTSRRGKKAFKREYSSKQTLTDSSPMPTLSSEPVGKPPNGPWGLDPKNLELIF